LILGAERAVERNLWFIGRGNVICRIDDAAIECMQPRGFRPKIAGDFA